MNRQIGLFSTTLMVVTGLSLSYTTWQPVARAEAPKAAQTPKITQTAQRVDVCRQAGADYREMYTIEEETRSITICQKGKNYYYVQSAKG